MAPSTFAVETPSEAQSVALRNFSSNLRALADSQPNLIAVLRRPDVEWEWLYARDGSLTAQSPDTGHWLADCSLPYRAASAMLKSLDLRGTAACLLAPNHAHQIRRSLELIKPEQALLVISPDPEFLPLALHCHDFSSAIQAGRLFLAAGKNWSDDLASLFQSYPGLPTPSLFLRPPTTLDSFAQPLIESAHQVFRQTNTARTDTLKQLAQAHSASRPLSLSRICLIAPSIFRLWADASRVLADTLAADKSVELRRFDPDRPSGASNLALATTAAGCDAVCAVNFTRADVPPEVLSPQIPWLTWTMTPNLPDGNKSSSLDRLILSDPAWTKPALAAGWKSHQLSVAVWPTVELPHHPDPAGLALIVDTHPLRTDINEETFEYSSHMVLWELIESELRTNPLLAADDPDQYLTSRMNRLSITPDGFNRAYFLDHLILPAYQQAIARLLIAAKIPLRLFGQGWDQIPEFAPHAQGLVESRAALHQAAASAQSLIHPAPGKKIHPIQALNRPLLIPAGSSPEKFLHTAKLILSRPPASRPPAHPPLNAPLLLSILRQTISS